MKRKDLYLPNDIFDLLPTEEVKASEVVQGDIFFAYNQWGLVYTNKFKKVFCNNGSNQLISCVRHGCSYLPPDHKAKIIQRSLVNKERAQEMIAQYEAEEVEREKWRKEEEKEEKERLREMRDELNRELGEDD